MQNMLSDLDGSLFWIIFSVIIQFGMDGITFIRI